MTETGDGTFPIKVHLSRILLLFSLHNPDESRVLLRLQADALPYWRFWAGGQDYLQTRLSADSDIILLCLAAKMEIKRHYQKILMQLGVLDT